MDADKRFNVSSQGDRASQDLTEIRANSFASCFLMPPELLKKLGDVDQWRRPEKVVEIAGRLFVSIPALLSALRRDKILDEAAISAIKDAHPRLPDKQEPELMGDFTALQLDRKVP